MQGVVLVLNQNYLPLTVCSFKRAFLLVYLQKADLIHASDNTLIRTVNESYACPSVIKINRYVNAPYRGVVLTRHNVFRRDSHKCQYCGETKDLTLDHVIPKSKGGKTNWKNLVTACKKCNTKKGDLSVKEAGLTLKKPPFRPSQFMFLADVNGNIREEWLPFLGMKNSA